MRAVLLTLFGTLLVSMAMAMPKVHKHANGHDAIVLSPSGHSSLRDLEVTQAPPADAVPAAPDVTVTNGHGHDHDDHAATIGKWGDAIKACTATGPCRQNTVGTTPAAKVQVGTPLRDLLVIFDTGSDKLVAKTALTIRTELASLDGGIANTISFTDQIYDHDNSSTYNVKMMTDTKTNETGMIQSTITYGSGTAVCLEGMDDIRVGGRTFNNFTLLEISTDSLGLLHTKKALGGVLGLQHMKNKSLGRSLFSRFREADLLSSFGYCRGTGNNGTFIWGDDSTEGTEMKVIGQMHWAVTLGTVMVHWPEKDESTHVAKDAGEAPAPETPTTAPKSPLEVARDKVVDKYKGDKGILQTPAPSFIAKNDIDETDDADDDSFITRISDYFLGSTVAREAREAMVTLQNTCPDNKCTGILDTGSNIIAGPTKAIDALKKLVDVSPNCSNVDSLPVVKFTLGGMEVTTEPQSYVMRVTKEEQQVFLEDTEGGSLEEKASRARSSANRQWIEQFDRLYRDYAVDLRDTVDKMLKQHDVTGLEDMCMSAFVAIDKQTEFGPLWVIGTPLMDTYYTKWNFPKDAESPTINMMALKDSKTCQEGGVLAEDTTAPAKGAHSLVRKEPAGLLSTRKESAGLLRKEVKAKPSPLPKRGPIARKIEDISFPHWAKDLKQV